MKNTVRNIVRNILWTMLAVLIVLSGITFMGCSVTYIDSKHIYSEYQTTKKLMDEAKDFNYTERAVIFLPNMLKLNNQILWYKKRSETFFVGKFVYDPTLELQPLSLKETK